VAALRIAIGVLMLKASWGKVTSWGAWTPQGFLQRNLDQERTFAFFRPFVEHVALPYHQAFGWMVAWGELLVGISLIVGALTRLSAFFGLVMLFSFMWAKGLAFWVGSNYDALWILILATVMFTGAGRVLGVDRLLLRRYGNRWYLW
jgi:thiosulfate dehydrogenase [quinone] large subunit